MRRPRLLAPPGSPSAIYHCLSRVVDRRFIFDDLEKQRFLDLLRECADFCEVRILTFCLMSNHFHLLVEVPAPPPNLPSAEVLLDKLARLSSRQDLQAFRNHIDHFRRLGDPAAEAAFLAPFHARLWNLSAFLKLLKQRFSLSYNRRHGRCGTLWEERFKSVLVQGTGHPLLTLAAYIDLNPVRAGLVQDPKDYRWCGYAEALAGRKAARLGIQRLVTALLLGHEESPGRSLEIYRTHLFRHGDPAGERTGDDGRPLRGCLSRQEVLQVLEHQGRLSPADYLQCRVRYFTDGVILGSRAFVEEMFHAFRHRFGPRRRSGARRLRGLDPNVDLFSVRDLRLRVFG